MSKESRVSRDRVGRFAAAELHHHRGRQRGRVRQQRRIDAAQQQALPADAPCIVLQQLLHTFDFTAVIGVGLIDKHHHRCRLTAGPALRMVCGYLQHQLFVVMTDRVARSLFITGKVPQRHPVGGQIVAQLRCGCGVQGCQHEVAVGFRACALDHALGHHPEQQRHQHRADDKRRHHRAPVAQVLEELFNKYRAYGAHQSAPACSVSCTKACSRSTVPVRANSCSGLPHATTQP